MQKTLQYLAIILVVLFGGITIAGAAWSFAQSAFTIKHPYGSNMMFTNLSEKIFFGADLAVLVAALVEVLLIRGLRSLHWISRAWTQIGQYLFAAIALACLPFLFILYHKATSG